MANLPYYVEIADAAGTPLDEIAFGGLGQSPGIDYLVLVPSKANLDPGQVSILNLKRGSYAVMYDAAAHGEAFIILDIGPDYQGIMRYRSIPLTAAPAASGGSESSGPSAATIAAAILANPAHLLQTDGNGKVTTANPALILEGS